MSDSESPVHVVRPALPEGEPRTVIVAAPARGGTSFMSSIVHHVGVPLEGPAPRYENLKLRIAFQKQEGLDEEIARLNAKYPIWGWKLPSLSHRLDELAAQLRNPHFIFIFKDPAAIAFRKRILHSQIREADPSMKTSRQEDVLRTLSKALGVQQKLITFAGKTDHPCLLVSYEKGVSNRPELIRAMAEFTGMPAASLDFDKIVEGLQRDHKAYKARNERKDKSFATRRLKAEGEGVSPPPRPASPPGPAAARAKRGANAPRRRSRTEG